MAKVASCFASALESGGEAVVVRFSHALQHQQRALDADEGCISAAAAPSSTTLLPAAFRHCLVRQALQSLCIRKRSASTEKDCRWGGQLAGLLLVLWSCRGNDLVGVRHDAFEALSQLLSYHIGEVSARH